MTYVYKPSGAQKTNVYCDHCGSEVGSADSFVVEKGPTGHVVRAYHFICGAAIYNAMQAAILNKEKMK